MRPHGRFAHCSCCIFTFGVRDPPVLASCIEIYYCWHLWRFFPHFYSYLCYSILQFNTFIYFYIPIPVGIQLFYVFLYFIFVIILAVCLFLFGKKNIEKTPLGCIHQVWSDLKETFIHIFVTAFLQFNTYICVYIPIHVGILLFYALVFLFFVIVFGCLFICLFLFGRKGYRKKSIILWIHQEVWLRPLWLLPWYLACVFVSLETAIWRPFTETWIAKSESNRSHWNLGLWDIYLPPIK